MLRDALSGCFVLLTLSVPARAADETPLTIAVSEVGDFAEGGSWYLSVNSAGKAELTIAPGRSQWKRICREFELTDKQMAEFRTALDKVSFFDLADEYGEYVPDGSEQTLTVTRGNQAATVKVRFLMNWVVANDLEKLRDPSRAVQLIVLTRGWFADAEAVDLRRSNKMVLDAVE